MSGEMIQTTRGLWPAAGLEKREGVDDNDNETATWVEYWLDGELVHRSVHMHLKRGMFADGIVADFS